jgi:hypothetical protein
MSKLSSPIFPDPKSVFPVHDKRRAIAHCWLVSNFIRDGLREKAGSREGPAFFDCTIWPGIWRRSLPSTNSLLCPSRRIDLWSLVFGVYPFPPNLSVPSVPKPSHVAIFDHYREAFLILMLSIRTDVLMIYFNDKIERPGRTFLISAMISGWPSRTSPKSKALVVGTPPPSLPSIGLPMRSQLFA